MQQQQDQNRQTTLFPNEIYRSFTYIIYILHQQLLYKPLLGPYGAPIKIAPSVCTHVTTERLNEFRLNFYWGVLQKFVDTSYFDYDRTKITDTLHENVYAILCAELAGWAILTRDFPCY
jgi:hypothetical protein